jgi:hypothetical protein
MNHLEIFLSWSTLSFEMALCGFVFVRKLYRILPLFTLYSFVVLANTVIVFATYQLSGYNSIASYDAYWISIVVNAGARGLAIMELCRYGLREYRGIWALIWRILAAATALLIVRVASDAWGQPNKVAIYGATLDRDLALASIIILAVLLLMRNYYGLALEPLQKAIASGICLICAVDVIGVTIVRNFYTGYLFGFFLQEQKSLWTSLYRELIRVQDFWSTIHLFCFMLAMGIWCYALRKPLAAPSRNPVLLPAEVYRELSPAINMRLSMFNNRLVELLKP